MTCKKKKKTQTKRVVIFRLYLHILHLVMKLILKRLRKYLDSRKHDDSDPHYQLTSIV